MQFPTHPHFFLRVLSHKGFSLVGVLVASAIGLIVISGTGSLVYKVTLSVKRTENLAYTTSLFNQVSSFLQDPKICKETLKDKTTDSGSNKITQIKKEGESIPIIIIDFAPPKELKVGDVKLTEIIVKEIDSDQKIAKLELKFEALSGTLLRKTHELDLYQIETDGVGANTKITSCVAGESNIDCYEVNADKQQSLVGCGGTIDSTTDDLTAFGYQAGLNNIRGDNSFFGYKSGLNNTRGWGNSFFGYEAGLKNTRGVDNSFFGRWAGKENTGHGNSFFGQWAGYGSTTGDYNSFFGAGAGGVNAEGNRNAYIGYEAGRHATGSDNTFVGYRAGFRSTGNNNIFIGKGTVEESNNNDNQLNIGNIITAKDTGDILREIPPTAGEIHIYVSDLQAENVKICTGDGSDPGEQCSPVCTPKNLACYECPEGKSLCLNGDRRGECLNEEEKDDCQCDRDKTFCQSGFYQGQCRSSCPTCEQGKTHCRSGYYRGQCRTSCPRCGPGYSYRNNCTSEKNGWSCRATCYRDTPRNRPCPSGYSYYSGKYGSGCRRSPRSGKY